MSLIDTHCHLKSFIENNTLYEVLERARSVGVESFITVGTNPEDWSCYQALSQSYKNIYYTAGLHPCYVDQNWRKQVEYIPAYWNHANPPVSFGEIGLDYFRLPKDKSKSNDIIKRQQDCLCAQLDMAKALDCPIIIHSRNSFEDCVKFIDQSGVDWQKVVFHCFSEGINQLMELIKRGGRASFTGNITYIQNSKVLEAIKAQGIETLMIETDSPYLSPEPNRKSINEPSRINDILEFISSLIDYDYDDLKDTVFYNSRRFYNLSMSSNS